MEDPDLDHLLKNAYPAVEASPDFKFRLWKRLLDQPSYSVWRIPMPLIEAALAAGLLLGFWNWSAVLSPALQNRPMAALQSPVRLDVFGNAPYDSLAGSYLQLAEAAQ